MFSSCAKKGSETATTDSTQTTATAPNNVEANKAGVRAFYDTVINGHNIAAIDKYCAENVVDHNPDPGQSGQGIAAIKKGFQDWFASMPDVHISIDQIMGEGDMVTAISTMTGTMKGDMGPMKATGKSCKVMNIDIIKLKDGKCVERWGLADQMAMMQQLGMMPPPPTGAPGDKKKMKM
jgi:predicted ester cyclase